MREMKDSGIAWIGEVPKDWEVSNFRYNGSFVKGKLPTTSNDKGIGLPIIGASEMLGKECRVFTEKNDIPICDKKDILILWDGANAGIIANGLSGVVSSTAVKYTCSNANAFYQYVYYMFKSVEPYFKSKVNGTTIPHMNIKYINEVPLLQPSLKEQHLISSYLDAKCSEIDSALSLQEQMISELRAYKQSLITEVVTHGLNPNAKMKNSGVEWIGEIPEGWEVVPIKYIFNRRSHKNNPVETTERLSLSIDKGVTLYSEKTTNLDRFKDDFTQYQLAHPNDIILNCMNMIVGAVGLSKYFGCVSPVYYVIYASTNEVNPNFYNYYLNTISIRSIYHSLGKGIYAIERGEGRVNTCRLKVSYGDFGRIEIPLPPLSEQRSIATFLDEKCAEIDALIVLREKKMEALKEYKKSLIYECVTGKKEIV